MYLYRIRGSGSAQGHRNLLQGLSLLKIAAISGGGFFSLQPEYLDEAEDFHVYLTNHLVILLKKIASPLVSIRFVLNRRRLAMAKNFMPPDESSMSF